MFLNAKWGGYGKEVVTTYGKEVVMTYLRAQSQLVVVRLKGTSERAMILLSSAVDIRTGCW
jgi:hypothetical protein